MYRVGTECEMSLGVARMGRAENHKKERTMAQDSKKLNGLDTTQMVGTIEAIQNQPALARFEFRNRNRWVAGGENRSTIQGFYGAGQEDSSRTEPFRFVNGEPPVLLGNNEGANPVEFLLHALAGCVTTTLVLHATARGIRIDSISTEPRGVTSSCGRAGVPTHLPRRFSTRANSPSTTRRRRIRHGLIFTSYRSRMSRSPREQSEAW